MAAGNLLVQDGVLAAVIDFGTCGVGDPACDVTIAWTLLADGSREAFRRRLSLGPGTWARGRGWALWKALITYAGAIDTDSAEADGAKRVLGEIFAEYARATWPASADRGSGQGPRALRWRGDLDEHRIGRRRRHDAVSDDVRAVEVANEAFYRAIESADLDLLDAVVLDGAAADAVTSVHPGWPMLRGRSEVMRSFAAVMAGTPYIQFILTDLDVRTVGDVAVVTCSENILTGVERESDGSTELGFAAGRVVATNVFRRTPTGWRLWVHHASPVISPDDEDDDGDDDGDEKS